MRTGWIAALGFLLSPGPALAELTAPLETGRLTDFPSPRLDSRHRETVALSQEGSPRIEIYNTAMRFHLGTVVVPNGERHARLHVQPNGLVGVLATDAAYRIYGIRTGIFERNMGIDPDTRTSPYARHVAWSPDGQSVAVAAEDGRRLVVYTVGDGQLRTVDRWRWGRVGSFAWSPDSTSLAAASEDRHAEAWIYTRAVGANEWHRRRTLHGHGWSVRRYERLHWRTDDLVDAYQRTTHLSFVAGTGRLSGESYEPSLENAEVIGRGEFMRSVASGTGLVVSAFAENGQPYGVPETGPLRFTVWDTRSETRLSRFVRDREGISGLLDIALARDRRRVRLLFADGRYEEYPVDGSLAAPCMTDIVFPSYRLFPYLQ